MAALCFYNESMARILIEGGDRLLTEGGDFLVLESHVASGVIDESAARDTWLCILLQIDLPTARGGTQYLWSGVGTLLFDNVEWQGLGSVIEFTRNENTTEHPSMKVTVTLNSEYPLPNGRKLNSYFMDPIGNLPVTMTYVKSTDEGQTWSKLPIGRRGYTSNLRQQSGRILIDIVHPFEIAFRRRPRYWSNEDARRRNSSDSGFAQMREISSGVNIRFPYLKQYSE